MNSETQWDIREWKSGHPSHMIASRVCHWGNCDLQQGIWRMILGTGFQQLTFNERLNPPKWRFGENESVARLRLITCDYYVATCMFELLACFEWELIVWNVSIHTFMFLLVHWDTHQSLGLWSLGLWLCGVVGLLFRLVLLLSSKP